MFRLSRNERSHWSGNGVHVEPESVFMIGRNMQQRHSSRESSSPGLGEADNPLEHQEGRDVESILLLKN